MVAGVILAAGESRRLGRPKQLLDYRGSPLIAHVVRSALDSGLGSVTVVLGANEAKIREAVDLSETSVVSNPDFADGQSTSVAAALSSIGPGVDGVLFLLGDQPGVTSDVIDAVVEAFDGGPQRIVMPSWQGVPANPVLFGRGHFAELSGLDGDEGARSIVRRLRESVVLVPVDRPVPPDIDTEDDYRLLLESEP